MASPSSIGPPIANNKKFWREFIRTYRDLPELWKVKSDVYRNRSLKNDAYTVLVNKLKLVDKDATRETARKKINVLRTTYRKELRKLESNQKYIPTLWYFNDIDFLRDHEIKPTDESTTDDMDVTQEDEISIDTKWVIIDPEPLTVSVSPPANNQTEVKTERPEEPRQEEPRQEEPSQEPENNIRTRPSHAGLFEMEYDPLLNNEVDILTKYWAQDFLKLKPDQQIFAKKAINDILFEGLLGNLHRHSVAINVHPSTLSSSLSNGVSHSRYKQTQ